VANAFLVLVETALFKSRRGKLEEQAEEGDEQAAALLPLLDDKIGYGAAVQIGMTGTALLLGWYGGPIVADGLASLAGAEGIREYWVSMVVALLLLVVLHVGLAELVPRVLVAGRAERVLQSAAWALRCAHFLFYPLVSLTSALAKGVVRLFGIQTVPVEDIARNEEELRRIVNASEKRGELDKVESTLIDNVLEFNDRVAREVMIPRQDMVCLFTDDTLAENLDTIRTSCHTRYPLCEEDKDHVLGMVHVRDLMDHTQDKEFDLRSIMRRIIVVSENMSGAKVMQMMQAKRIQIAVVVDEYGGTTGLLTLEDLVEEIIGEIQDEHDQPEAPEIVHLPDGNYELDGEVLLEELDELLHVDLEDADEDDTIGGYIFGALGRKPVVGDEVTADGWRFVILKMDNLRVERVRAERVPAAPAEPEE
jgi:CBS domain containing-hemolysin-like protein